MKDSHSDCHEFLGVHHLLGARTRDLRQKDVAKDAICGCGGIFHFFERSENRVVEFGAVAFEFLHLSRGKVCARSKEAGAEHFVEEAFV